MNPLPVLACAGVCILLATTGGVAAQTAAPPPMPAAAPSSPPAGRAQPAPEKLEPLPEIPPPEGVENGALIWIKVTPRTGVPYYLIPTGQGANTFVRANSLDTALSVPMWQLFTW